MTLPSPNSRIPKLSAKQPDLACVQHFVAGAPQQCLELCLRQRMWMRNRLIQFSLAKTPHFLKHPLMHSVENGSDVGLTGVLGRIGVRNSPVTKKSHKIFREQLPVLRLHPSNSPKRQAILGNRQMAHLPSYMADATRRQPKPIRCGGLFEKPDGVIAGENNLLDGKL